MLNLQRTRPVFPDDPPEFLLRTPHGYHDAEQIRRELSAAGFAAVDVETLQATSSARSPEHPAIAYCQGTPLRNEIEARDPGKLEDATRAASDAIRSRFGSGPVSGQIQAKIITARRDS